VVKIDLLRDGAWLVPSIRETHPLLRTANREERRGRLKRAIEALNQYLQSCPKDLIAMNHMGDLYLRLNRTGAAIEQFARVARFLADDGFYAKAIAVWKKVLRNDPSMLEAYTALSDLYAKQGLVAQPGDHAFND
jgi:tetratricopeptide (TPR) repeat protein